MKQVIANIRFFSLLLMLCSPTIALANISLDKVVVRFEQGSRPVNNISVTNGGSEIIKVRTEIVEIKNPGQENVLEVKTRELSVAPRAFELKPDETRVARVVLRKFPKDMEKMFRVRFIPDNVEQEIDQKQGEMSVKIGLIIGMGALVLAAPQNPAPDFVFDRKDGKITFTNKGNVTAQVQREDFCNSDKTECVSLEGRRVYPGAAWVMNVPPELKGKPFSQTVFMNNSYNKMTFPP